MIITSHDASARVCEEITERPNRRPIPCRPDASVEGVPIDAVGLPPGPSAARIAAAPRVAALALSGFVVAAIGGSMVAAIGGLAVAVLGSGSAAYAAAAPTSVNYQGRLTDNSPQQTPVSGTVDMTFAIYDAQTAGTSLWLEPASGTVSVQVNEGIFNVLLGENGVPLPPSVFGGGTSRWLEITVDGETLAPRQRIGSVPYALRAETAADAGSLGGSPVASWQMRVSSSCPSGSAINAIGANGSVTCVVGPTGPQGPPGPTGPPGPAGTTGQSGTTVYGISQMTVTSAMTSFTLIPGMTMTVNVPASAIVYLAADGGVATTSTTSGGFSVVDIALFIDGVQVAPGGFHRVPAANSTGLGMMISNWSLSLSKPLSVGMHTFEVRTKYNNGASALVSGDGTSVLQAELTALVLKL